MEARDYDAIIVDHQMPRLTGMAFLERLRDGDTPAAGQRDIPVIVVTAYGTIEMAVKAMKDGAYSYLTKPIEYDDLSRQVKNAVERRRLSRELETLRHEVEEKYQFGNILGKNPRMHEIFQVVRTVAETDATVLIQGESGTGKELIARAIHYNSRRKDRPFVVVSCSALPETLLESELFGHEKGAFTGAIRRRIGRFEHADGGTIFLDEIGEMTMPVQLKLLRVLQEREVERVGGNETIKVDVRVIAATHKDLFRAIRERSFREDLFYRLNVVPIKLPPSGNGWTMCRSWPPISSKILRPEQKGRSCPFRPRRSRRLSATPSPATCANWRTSSNAPSSWKRATPSAASTSALPAPAPGPASPSRPWETFSRSRR